MRRLTLQLTTAALAALSFLGAPAAHAAPVFDVGPAGTTAAQPTVTAESQLTTATVVESHLPTWLQVVVAKAPLYATDTTSDETVTQLPRYTFLRVLSGGAQRLHVQAYDDDDNPAQTGWVDSDQVLPSAPATDWLVASEATTLWSAADSSATTERNLARFTPLQKIDAPTGDRVLVRVYRPDFSGIVDQGWVDATATGPALAPQVRVPAPDRSVGLGLASPTSTLQQQDFLDAAAQAARQARAATGVPASVTVAQAILESDWGRSALARNANNYFGIKAIGTLGDDGVVWMPTSEFDDSGQLYQTMSAFRAYKSLADSIADYDRLLGSSSRYASAMQVANDPKQFARQIALDGYSTDPAYADKVIALMDRYNLYQLDA